MRNATRRPRRPSPPARRAIRPGCEQMEDRQLLATVNFAIDASRNARPISRFVYGVNQSLTGPYANNTFERLGGNRWTAYNWENNASNAGSDYLYQNDSYLGGGNMPGGAVGPTLADASSHNAGALITVPINGYVSADKNGGGDVRNSGSNYLQTRFRQEPPRKNAPFSLTPDTNDGYVYQDEFVNWVKSNYAYGETDPNRPIMYSLDNEPDLWSSTHAEIHPSAATYAEMVQKTIDYAGAIKSVAPGSKVFGPVNYGWEGLVNLQDAPDANGRDFQSFYLQQLKQAETTYGKRLVDALDVHWYPEAQGGGVRITGSETTDAVVAARLQAPRSLWDPTYTETSWITQWSTGGPINLLPRLQSNIDANYPGTKLAITEYNYGGGSHISGGIAEADVLGIFGRDGVYAANEWALASNESFIGAAFQMYRNFDGANGTFGATSVSASTSDVAASSVYASVDPSNPNVMTLVVINKSSAPLTSVMALAGVSPNATAKIYQLTSASASPVAAGQTTVANPSSFSYTMPAYSVSTIRIVSSGTTTNAAPTVATPAGASPSVVTGKATTLSVLGADDGGESNLTYTWTTVGTPPAPVTFSANGNNAAKSAGVTFSRAGAYTFQVTVSDGSLSTTSSVNVVVSQTLTTVKISQSSITLLTGATQQFAASGLDQFGTAMSVAPAFAWSLASGAGTVSASGRYTAPATAGTATVKAASGTISATASVTINAIKVPAAPTKLTTPTVTATSVRLSWMDNSTNEAGFLIERSIDGKTWSQVASVGANLKSYTVLGLTASKTYYFRVRAYNAGGASAYTGVLTVKTRRS